MIRLSQFVYVRLYVQHRHSLHRLQRTLHDWSESSAVQLTLGRIDGEYWPNAVFEISLVDPVCCVNCQDLYVAPMCFDNCSLKRYLYRELPPAGAWCRQTSNGRSRSVLYTLREFPTGFQWTPQYMLNYQVCLKSIHRMISSLYSMPAVVHVHFVYPMMLFCEAPHHLYKQSPTVDVM